MACHACAACQPPSACLQTHPRSLYFTVHTTGLPNGALRGQISLRQSPQLVALPGADAPELPPVPGPALAPVSSPTPAPVLAPEPSAEPPTSEPPMRAPEPADAPTSEPAPGPAPALLAPAPAPALASPSSTPTALPVVRLRRYSGQQQGQLPLSPCQPLALHPHAQPAVPACPRVQEWRAALLPSRNGDAGANGAFTVMLQPDGETFGQVCMQGQPVHACCAELQLPHQQRLLAAVSCCLHGGHVLQYADLTVADNRLSYPSGGIDASGNPLLPLLAGGSCACRVWMN